MPSPQKPPIKYTSRDFDSIRNDLIEHAKRYYSSTFQDFNEASFGSLVLDTVAYIGDVLSFYVDYQANESFVDTAVELRNVIKHGKQTGYKYNNNPSSYGVLSCYVQVPANTVGVGPNLDYAPTLKRGSEFTSIYGTSFSLIDDIDFKKEANQIVVARANPTTGLPTYYAIKAFGRVKSGRLVQENVTLGEFVKFLRVKLNGSGVSEIDSVFDSEGNEYFEVDYLSQNVIHKSVLNKNSDRKDVNNILKPFVIPRRFVVEHVGDSTYLQFGFGSETELGSPSIAEPTNVILDLVGRDYISDISFDPSKLMKTDKFGVAPSNTKLSIFYRINDTSTTNASVDSVTEVSKPLLQFDDRSTLNSTKIGEVVNSLEVTNEEKIVGDIKNPDVNELKRLIIDSYATQNRAVTEQDYKSIIYSMPNKFGKIKRITLKKDKDSFKRNLNLFVVAENSAGNLSTATSTLKSNLKTWVSRYKMINDTVDILDAHIVNLGIEFVAVGEEEENKFDLLQRVINRIKKHLEVLPDIGENFNISDIYSVINKTRGVIDATSVKVVNKVGGVYSDVNHRVEANLEPSGRYLYVPENFIWEVKYPNSDILGTIK